MTIYLSLAVAVVGALMFVYCKSPNLKEIGRLSYGVGALAFLLNAVHVFSATIR